MKTDLRVIAVGGERQLVAGGVDSLPAADNPAVNIGRGGLVPNNLDRANFASCVSL